MLPHYFNCPNCLQEISMQIDPSISKQQYIEDCEVCCNPLQIHVEVIQGEINQFYAQLAQ
ncbi:MAG: transcription elongation factor Elf1 [Marivirga sp.]|jgi:transcription elongation factor Elf1